MVVVVLDGIPFRSMESRSWHLIGSRQPLANEHLRSHRYGSDVAETIDVDENGFGGMTGIGDDCSPGWLGLLVADVDAEISIEDADFADRGDTIIGKSLKGTTGARDEAGLSDTQTG